MFATSTEDILYTPKQAAEILNVRVQTLAVWRSSGKWNLPFIKLGNSIRYSRADLDAWIESRRTTHTS